MRKVRFQKRIRTFEQAAAAVLFQSKRTNAIFWGDLDAGAACTALSLTRTISATVAGLYRVEGDRCALMTARQAVRAYAGRARLVDLYDSERGLGGWPPADALVICCAPTAYNIANALGFARPFLAPEITICGKGADVPHHFAEAAQCTAQGNAPTVGPHGIWFHQQWESF